MEGELEALRREREEKIKLIAEKRRQVEELKRRRAERVEEQKRSGKPNERRGSSELGRSVDSLVAEILGGETAPAAAGKAGAGKAAASPEVPLRELAASASTAAKGAGRPDRSLYFQQELAVVSVAVEAQEANVYERSVQTDLVAEQIESHQRASPKLQKAPTSVLMKMAERARNRGTMAAQHDGRPGTRTGQQAQPDGKEASASAAPAEELPQELTPEERERAMQHPDFQKFFQRTTLLVERALGQQTWDVVADFGSGEGGLGDAEAENQEQMKYVGDHAEERWARSRPVTDVRFSPHRAEMFLAAYGQRANPALSDPDGCMLVWNLAMQSRPELAFSSPSAVLTAHFHRFDPALFFGGTHSGGVVLWDARAKSGPVLRTPLSGKGHSHPVQAMQQVGTKNATNLVTASNDGRLCVWSLAMLNLPQETVDLKNETKNRRDLAVMTLSFPENETNTLYVGAEDGSVCQVHIHGSKVGVTELYDGHEGPVAGIDMHPHQGDASQHGVDASIDLALTCSFDWSVKLWMVKQYQSPVLSLDAFEDYVYDVGWHPAHPAVFSSVDGEGHVDLWNLNANLESPVVRCEHPSQRKLALNHCHWSIDGRKLVTGDSEGTISVYTVDRTVAQPRNEDFQLFQERVRQLQPIVSRGSRESGAYGLDARFAPLPRGVH
mmetsp:Transcript_61706/g.198835  ORF Transcript_61706/g.198835 Transcript_61706/m.198835 type:complete len:668 (-) Transcript_61706:204-2207(-)